MTVFIEFPSSLDLQHDIILFKPGVIIKGYIHGDIAVYFLFRNILCGPHICRISTVVQMWATSYVVWRINYPLPQNCLLFIHVHKFFSKIDIFPLTYVCL